MIVDIVVYMKRVPHPHEEKDSVYPCFIPPNNESGTSMGIAYVCVCVYFSLAGVVSSKGIYIYIREKKGQHWSVPISWSEEVGDTVDSTYLDTFPSIVTK